MKTKLIVALTLVALFVSACGAAGSPANPASADQFAGMTATAMISSAQTEVGSITNPTSEPTSLPTESATAAFTATIAPTATLPAPTFTLTPVSIAPVNVACDKHGTVAWQNDNQLDGQPYGEAPVGGLDEVCGVVGQTHWKEADSEGNMVEVRAVFYVQPHMVAWLSGHLGGTGWYFGGTRADIEANLAEQASQLEERDGKMKTYVIIMPEDADNFPILTRFQVKK